MHPGTDILFGVAACASTRKVSDGALVDVHRSSNASGELCCRDGTQDVLLVVYLHRVDVSPGALGADDLNSCW